MLLKVLFVKEISSWMTILLAYIFVVRGWVGVIGRLLYLLYLGFADVELFGLIEAILLFILKNWIFWQIFSLSSLLKCEVLLWIFWFSRFDLIGFAFSLQIFAAEVSIILFTEEDDCELGESCLLLAQLMTELLDETIFSDFFLSDEEIALLLVITEFISNFEGFSEIVFLTRFNEFCGIFFM